MLFGVSATVLTFIDVDSLVRIVSFVVIASICILGYVYIFLRVNKLERLILEVNNSTLSIFFGDIFEQEEIKIIPLNEYFDTTMDEDIISPNTLHGKYIRRLDSTKTLDHEIEKSDHLKEKILDENSSRKKGKKIRYKLGTIHKRQKYFLLAFSKFDDQNKAYLTMNEYVQCLLNMWGEIDTFYNGDTVTIPLLGSGITRMKDNTDITDQELLEIIIWTFRISKVKFTYPSQVRIIIHLDKKDKIDLFKIEGDSYGA